MQIKTTKIIRIPNPVLVERLRRSPDLGPAILFFSGGTAMKNASSELIHYTHNSIHMITPFDSGGSSAKIRQAFHMLAVGDIRNRLLALADRSLQGYPEIFELFSYRFGKQEKEELLQELDRMIKGRHRLVAGIIDPMRKIIRRHIALFAEHMPDDFDLRKASIGNLILTGGFLDNKRHLDPVIYIFSKLVRVLGVVRPVISKDLHLVAQLDNGETIVGQHLLTGKETDPIQSKIKCIYLSAKTRIPERIRPAIRKKIRNLIRGAELICYPMGSYYTSILANLLPAGVGKAVAENPCPKVYIPNTAYDPEQYGLSLTEQISRLVSYLSDDNPENIRPTDVLNYVMIDSKNAHYSGGVETEKIEKMGIEIIDCPLISQETSPLIDETLLVPNLLSLT